MRASTIIMRGLALIIIAMLVVPPGIPAQDSGQPEQSYRFSEGELAQMLAPIALYPDSLIAQILMASTYPLELVEAERWLRQNNALQGDKLDAALQDKNWDPSIKSLCHFTDVLFALSDKLDQTRKLGDAFLSQQDDVMNTIQTLRLKAEEQGNLKTTAEQKVIVEKEIIRIEPADPYVVYVPAYDPYYVYGPWWYPAYPPWYWYSPAGVVISSGFIAFGLPFYIGLDLFLWPWFDWHGHHVYSDYYHYPYYDRRYRNDRDYGRHYWEHDPFHRKGVAYRDSTTSRRYRPSISPRPRTDSATRGYPDRSSQRQGVRSSEQRQGVRSGEQRQSVRSGEQRQGAVAPRGRVESERVRTAPARDNTFRGVGSGNFERKASERGGISRQNREVTRQSEGIRPDRGSDRGDIRPDRGADRGGGGFRRR